MNPSEPPSLSMIMWTPRLTSSRFTKKIAGGLMEIRHAVNGGLFTAFPGEEQWGIAHRILLPAFGPLAITHM